MAAHLNVIERYLERFSLKPQLNQGIGKVPPNYFKMRKGGRKKSGWKK
jgi:hypothetical protein